MAAGDIVILVPPAILQVTGTQPLVDFTSEGTFGTFSPPNFKDGDAVHLDTRHIRTRDATFTYGGVEQTVTAFDAYGLDFTADTTGLGDLGTDQAALITTEATLPVIRYADNLLMHIDGRYPPGVPNEPCHQGATASFFTDPSGSAVNGLAEWNTTRVWQTGIPTAQFVPDYGSIWDTNMYLYDATYPKPATKFLATDWTLSVVAWVETTDLSETVALPKVFVSFADVTGWDYTNFAFGYKFATSKLYLYHHWGAESGQYNEYESTLTFTKGDFQHFHISHRLSDNRIFWGTDGDQESFLLTNNTFGSDGANWFYIGGAAPGTGTIFDDLSTTMTGSIAEVIIIDKLVFGEGATYTPPTANLVSAWSTGETHPYIESGGALWGSKDTAFQAGGKCAQSLTVAKSYDWTGVAWAYNSDLPSQHANHCGFFGSLGAALIAGGFALSNGSGGVDTAASFDGTSWTSEAVLYNTLPGCGGFGSFFDGIIIGGKPGSVSSTTATRLWDGSVWSAGAVLATASTYNWGSGTSAGGLSVGDGESTNPMYVQSFDGVSWSNGAAPSYTLISHSYGGTPTNGVMLYNDVGGPTPFSSYPEHYNGDVWSSMDAMAHIAYGGAAVGTGRWGHLMYAVCGGTVGNASVFYDGEASEWQDLSQYWPE